MRSRQVSPTTKIIDVALTTDTAIYASGDVLVATTAIPLVGSAFNAGPIRAFIDRIQLIDQSVQSGDLDIVFLDSNVSFGALNAVAAISAANALKVLSTTSLAAAGYTSLGANAVVANVIPARPQFVQTIAGDSNLYVALISRAAKTYAATALTLRLSVTLVSEEI